MSDPVRVLWLAKGLGRGGAETLLVNLAKAMDTTAIQLDVAYVLPHKDALVGSLSNGGARVHCLGGTRRSGGWPARLRDLLCHGGFDIVHSHAPVVGSAARVLAPRESILLHTEHNVWNRYRRPTRWANAATINRNRVVWAVSEGVADSIRPWAIGSRCADVEVMLHGIDAAPPPRGPEARAAALKRLGLSDGAFTVGTVGNLTPKKDHETLLRAMVSLRRLRSDARLVLIGAGPLEGRLRWMVQELGLGDVVYFTGSRDDVRELLPGLDLFVLSSLHEGLSIALVEALAAGLPVVATHVGGIPEVVTHQQQGLLVPAGDPQALAEAMSVLAKDDTLRARCAGAAPERAAKFGIQPAADALSERYVALADARQTSPARLEQGARRFAR